MGGFRRDRAGRVVVTLGDAETAALRQLLGELLDLLEQSDPGPPDDPLAAAVGIGQATTLPEDPALARLFPDGYPEDPEASADFRRYTEPGLRAGKRSAARTALGSLEPAPGRLHLDDEQALAWLRTLNDLRLALAERLGITEEQGPLADGVPDEDPRAYALAVYDLLTYLQDTLVEVLDTDP